MEQQANTDGPQVLVLPGVPNYAEVVDGVGAYPGCTTDIMKLLRLDGLTVAYRDDDPGERKQVSLFGIDIWLPVLSFTADAMANGAGDLIAGAIRSLFGRKAVEDGRLHVKFGRESADGECEWFEGSGPGDEVLESVKRFLKAK